MMDSTDGRIGAGDRCCTMLNADNSKCNWIETRITTRLRIRGFLWFHSFHGKYQFYGRATSCRIWEGWSHPFCFYLQRFITSSRLRHFQSLGCSFILFLFPLHVVNRFNCVVICCQREFYCHTDIYYCYRRMASTSIDGDGGCRGKIAQVALFNKIQSIKIQFPAKHSRLLHALRPNDRRITRFIFLCRTFRPAEMHTSLSTFDRQATQSKRRNAFRLEHTKNKTHKKGPDKRHRTYQCCLEEWTETELSSFGIEPKERTGQRTRQMKKKIILRPSDCHASNWPRNMRRSFHGNVVVVHGFETIFSEISFL